MHDILTTTHAALTERTAELESLIADAEQQCQAIADDGMRQVTAIKDKAHAEIDVIRAQQEKHATELIGVRHSRETLDAILTAASPDNTNETGPTVDVPEPAVSRTNDG